MQDIDVHRMVIECPLCRTINTIPEQQHKVYGVDNECVVCRDKMSELFLPNCGHVCLCYDCASLLERDEMSDDEQNALNIMGSTGFMGTQTGRIYTIVPSGMGCTYYVRRNSRNASFESFFIRGDDWEQYGDELSDFISGYTQVAPI
uniref:RING-type domain-containing protein n=1 Tax=viral metagenome TaxID=1070528 RepID=A0A6C0BJA8_9ZZZZ